MAWQSSLSDDSQAADTGISCRRADGFPLKILAADREVARLARALAHPARVAIVRYLVRMGECVCTDLSDIVPLAHSTVMQHMKVLKEAGILCSTREGRNVLYCVNPEVLRRLQKLVGEL